MSYVPLREQLARHLESLSPDEFKQADDISTYLAERASDPTGRIPEGSVAKLLNRQPPRIQQAFKGMQQVIATPREMPFQPKLSEAENMAQLGLDPDTGSTVMAALDYADVQQGVMDRMGTDAGREPEPLNTRDIIGAAIDFHSGAENG